jgi:hypothetical protein
VVEEGLVLELQGVGAANNKLAFSALKRGWELKNKPKLKEVHVVGTKLSAWEVGQIVQGLRYN